MCYRVLTICDDCSTKDYSEPNYCDKYKAGKLCLITADDSYMSSLVNASILIKGELDITMLIPVHVLNICKEVCAHCILVNMNKAIIDTDNATYRMNDTQSTTSEDDNTVSTEDLSVYSCVYDSSDENSSWVDEAFMNDMKD